MAKERSNRIEVLDSLRGIAAMEVLLDHFFSVFQPFCTSIAAAPSLPFWVNFLTYTPLHFIWAGHEAVIFFFTLSGFVLALPYMERRPPFYGAYAIRRICRIYLPYFALVTVSVLLYELQFCSYAIPGASDWLNSIWAMVIPWKEIVRLYFMLEGNIFNNHLAPTTWSLAHEMRVSLFFPLVAFLVLRLNWTLSLVFGILLAVWSNVFTPSFLTWVDLNRTVYYASFFVYGAVLAKYREPIGKAAAKYGTLTQTALLILAVLLYTWQWLPTDARRVQWPGLWSETVSDLANGLASLLFIILALNWERARIFLSQPGFLWLGKISYSLYLVHPLVLLMSVYYLHIFLPLLLSAVIGLIFSLVTAWLFYRWVERPSNNWGHRLADKKSIKALRRVRDA